MSTKKSPNLSHGNKHITNKCSDFFKTTGLIILNEKLLNLKLFSHTKTMRTSLSKYAASKKIEI